MRTRVAFFAVVLAAALTGCSSDDDPESGKSPSAPVSEITVDCAEFADTAAKITDAQTALYSSAGGAEATAAIETLETELDALKDGAPTKVDQALTAMIAAFRSAQEILEDPTPEAQAELAELTPELSEAGQTITAYIVEKCD